MPQFSSKRMERPESRSPALASAAPLLLVGAGKMGGAMLEGWLRNGLPPAGVTVLDPHLDDRRRSELVSAGARIGARPDELGDGPFKVAVIAVKPQTIDEALPAIAPFVKAETVIVSVAAGIRLDRLGVPFGPGQPVIRAMPNTPAQVGMGMTVAVANPNVTADQRATVDALLAAVGEVAWTEDEGLLDAVTAVSGSGPAYVFLLAECLAEAGRQAGLPSELAERAARQTVAGAGVLLADSPLPAATLRQNVTSPNGTTAAALSVLMAEGGLQPLLDRAVQAAKKRSIELG